MIDGVVIEKLAQFVDKRGKVMRMMSINSPVFKQFGEIYFSVVNPGAVKAWKRHRLMTLNLAAPHGKVKLALYDDRSDSPTKGKIQEIIFGEDNYCLVTIPSGVWSGFQGISNSPSIIANCATHVHDPEEADSLEHTHDTIPYTWQSPG